MTPALERIGATTVPADRAAVGLTVPNPRSYAGVPVTTMLPGGNANLALNPAADTVIATAGIPAGTMQSATIRQVWSDGVAVEYPMRLTGAAGVGWMPPKL